jgi:drug/metabolite transporter (DMT)-like permease
MMALHSTQISQANEVSITSSTKTVPMLQIYIILGLGVVCIAFSAIFIRLAGVPGTVSAFYRMFIAAFALTIPFTRNARQGHVTGSQGIWILAIGTGIFFAIDTAFWNTSLFLTSAANATLLANDAPIIVGLGAIILFHERLGSSYWLGLLTALAGMGLIVGADFLKHAQLGLGDLLAALAGVFYAIYLLAAQRVRTYMDTLSTLWISCLAGSVFLLIFNLATHHVLVGFSLHTYLMLLALGLISQVIGWLAINYALGHLPASIVSVTLLGQPVLTALLSVPFLSEAISTQQIIGGIIALLGIYLVNRTH